MKKTLEIASYHEIDAIRELTSKIYLNNEPGFQIEGVRSSDSLISTLDLLIDSSRTYSLVDKLGFDYSYAQFGELALKYREPETPHTDNGFMGLAVHQNITGVVPVTLATSNALGFYLSPKYVFEPGVARNFRRGTAIPGRLTIFSEGNDNNLLPTIHFFDRRKQVGNRYWVRYAQTGHKFQNKEVIKKIANDSMIDL